MPPSEVQEQVSQERQEAVAAWSEFLSGEGANGKKLLGGVVTKLLSAAHNGLLDVTVAEALSFDEEDLTGFLHSIIPEHVYRRTCSPPH